MRSQDFGWDDGLVGDAVFMARHHFSKMFPNVNYNGKYILWLNFGICWKGSCKGIDCRLRIWLEDGSYFELSNFRMRTFYPDKNWYVACMYYDRRISDSGVILYYDSFEELSKIKRIQAYWTVYSADKNYDKPFHLMVGYDVSFELAKGKRSYSIVSHESPFGCLGLVDGSAGAVNCFEDPFSEYENVFRLRSEKSDYSFFCVDDIKGQACERAFDSWWGLGESFKDDFEMECYFASEKLKAKRQAVYL